MRSIRRQATTAEVPQRGSASISRRRTLTALLAAAVALGFSGQTAGGGTAVASTGPEDLRVGHRVETMHVPDSASRDETSTKENTREVKVHLWYPADGAGLSEKQETVYRSALHEKPLVRGQWDFRGRWDPLRWEVGAETARENAPIDENGKGFPVIVFSHGSVNDPIDYVHTLELIAGQGFVVVAPYHANNTQEDVRTDFINTQAGSVPLFDCIDGRTPRYENLKPWLRCSRPSVPLSMADRVRDISSVLDNLPGWLGDRADVDRAGVMGHSRGTATALAAAGGSAARRPDANCQQSGDLCWPLEREPRIRAVMGMAIAAPAITRGVQLQKIEDPTDEKKRRGVTVPTLLVAGKLDETSPQAVSEFAFDQISSEEKAFVSLTNGTHRSFDSTYCDQTQAAGSKAKGNTRAILDLHTLRGIVAGGTSGRATQYCSYATFTDPVNIIGLVETLAPGFQITPESVPQTGLETDEVKDGMKELAVTFFGTVLKRTGRDGPHFTRYLAPKWLEKHEPMVGSAEAFASADAICPIGQEVVCED